MPLPSVPAYQLAPPLSFAGVVRHQRAPSSFPYVSPFSSAAMQQQPLQQPLKPGLPPEQAGAAGAQQAEGEERANGGVPSPLMLVSPCLFVCSFV